MLLAIRINPVVGGGVNEDGELEEGAEFDDAEEDLVLVDPDSIWDIENAIEGVRETLRYWSKRHT